MDYTFPLLPTNSGGNMKITSSYEKARIYIEQHSAEEEKAQKRRQHPGPTITISRETGIGASTICESLVKYFNKHAVEDYKDWVYFDRDLMEKIMEDHHLPEHFRKFLADEKPAKSTWVGEIIGVSPARLSILRKTSQTIKKIAEYGNAIIVGRGANIILANKPNTFHIRMVAPLSFRIDNAMKLYKHDRRKISEFIKEEDEARKNYIMKYFHKNIEDPLLYHTVINVNLLEVEEIAQMIGSCVVKRFPEFFLSKENYNINE